MPTYYEVLGIPPTATVAEVGTAYESQYNHWRRLVTHHDPEMVNKANQALRWLEKANVTLTDPAKREAYDTSIGLSGPVGGLTDPQAEPQKERPTPPPPRQRAEPKCRLPQPSGWMPGSVPNARRPVPWEHSFAKSAATHWGASAPSATG